MCTTPRRLLPSSRGAIQVAETSRDFLDTNILGYTNALGILSLRQRISQVRRGVARGPPPLFFPALPSPDA